MSPGERWLPSEDYTPSSEGGTSGPAIWNRCLKSTGFRVDEARKQGAATDLLQTTDASHTPFNSVVQVAPQDGFQTKSKTRTMARNTQVKLIQAVHLLAQHSKLVHVDVADLDINPGTCVF